MRDHHTSQHLCANLAGTDTRDYHLEQPLQIYVFTKVGEIFEDLPKAFGIADDVLVVDYDSDGKDYDGML